MTLSAVTELRVNSIRLTTSSRTVAWNPPLLASWMTASDKTHNITNWQRTWCSIRRPISMDTCSTNDKKQRTLQYKWQKTTDTAVQMTKNNGHCSTNDKNNGHCSTNDKKQWTLQYKWQNNNGHCSTNDKKQWTLQYKWQKNNGHCSTNDKKQRTLQYKWQKTTDTAVQMASLQCFWLVYDTGCFINIFYIIRLSMNIININIKNCSLSKC